MARIIAGALALLATLLAFQIWSEFKRSGSLQRIETALRQQHAADKQELLAAIQVHFQRDIKSDFDSTFLDSICGIPISFSGRDSALAIRLDAVMTGPEQKDKIKAFVFEQKIPLYVLFFKLLNWCNQERLFKRERDQRNSQLIDWIAEHYEDGAPSAFLQTQASYYQSLDEDQIKKKLCLDDCISSAFRYQETHPVRTRFLLANGLRMANRLKDARQRLAAKVVLHFQLFRMGYPASALALGLETVRECERLGFELKQAKLHFLNGSIYMDDARYDEAIGQFQAALLIYQRYNHGRNIANCYERLAVTSTLRGDYIEASQYLDMLADLPDGSKDLTVRTLEPLHRGLLSFEMGDYASAAFFFDEAIRRARKIGDRYNESVALANLGHLYSEMGDYERALEYHLKALAASRAAGSPLAEIERRINLVEAYLETGKRENALAHVDTVLQQLRNHKFGRLALKHQLRLGRLQSDSGSGTDGIKTLENALHSFQKVGDIAKQLESLNLISEAHLRNGEPDMALKTMAAALNLVDSHGQLAVAWQTYFLMAKTKAALNLSAEAELYLMKAISAISKLSIESEKDLDRASFSQRIHSVFEAMVLLKMASNIAEALHFSDMARAQVFRLLPGAATPPPNREIRAGTALAPVNPTPSLLPDIQQRLDRRAGVVQFELTEKRLITWLITADTLAMATSDLSRSELEALVTQLRTHFEPDSVRTFDRLQRSYRQTIDLEKIAYRYLLAPISALMENIDQLYFICDESLHYLSFAALMQPNDRFLTEDFNISYMPSLAVLRQHFYDDYPVTGRRHLLAVAGPGLEAADAEASTVAALSAQSQLLLAEEALEKSVCEHLVGGYDAVLFAVHATLDEKNPLNSALRLTEALGSSKSNTDGYLRLDEIQALPMSQTKVVYLSACQTASGRLYRGEGLISMQRAFMTAGAKSVIANLWRVDEDSASRLTVAFFEGWLNKHYTKTDALRRAQLDQIRDLRKHRLYEPHPYFWASPVLTGSFN